MSPQFYCALKLQVFIELANDVMWYHLLSVSTGFSLCFKIMWVSISMIRKFNTTQCEVHFIFCFVKVFQDITFPGHGSHAAYKFVYNLIRA